MKAIRIIGILAFVAISFRSGIMAQQSKIPKNPFRFTDAITGKAIPEVLVLPRYSSAKGIFVAPEGPAKATYRNYLDKPFLYRADAPFILKRPKFYLLPLFPVFIGKGRSIEGILIVAPKYRPVWFDNLWQTRDIWNTRDMRNLLLDPISDEEWSLLLEQDLSPLMEESVLSVDHFQFWGLYGDATRLHVDYNKRERELIKKFLASQSVASPNNTGLESKYFQSTTKSRDASGLISENFLRRLVDGLLFIREDGHYHVCEGVVLSRSHRDYCRRRGTRGMGGNQVERCDDRA